MPPNSTSNANQIYPQKTPSFVCLRHATPFDRWSRALQAILYPVVSHCTWAWRGTLHEQAWDLYGSRQSPSADSSGPYWIRYVFSRPLHGSRFVEDTKWMKFPRPQKTLFSIMLRHTTAWYPGQETNASGQYSFSYGRPKTVIASGAKQSAPSLDCFVVSLLAMTNEPRSSPAAE